MPATYAHYVFGKKVYKKLSKGEKEIICEAKDAFLLGLHGPDLLFYYYPLVRNRINRQGYQMHKEIAADFFEKGKMLYEQEKSLVLRAYLYGFLCHYILDSECHPYISFYMEENDCGHLELETEFDRYLMELDGYDPLEYVPIQHLISRRNTREQIARMFDDVTEMQIDVAIRMFRHTIRALVCKNPVKRAVLKTASRVTGQDKKAGGLLMDGQVNLVCEDSDWFLEERLEHAVEIAVEELENYSYALDKGGLLAERLYRDYNEIS